VGVAITNADSYNAGGTLGLMVNAMGLALRENGSGLSRFRITESGSTAPMSGIGFNVGVQFSGGYCYSVIQSSGGANTPFFLAPTTDGGTASTLMSMCTIAEMYAVNDNVGSYGRVRITSSGAGISGNGVKLIVGYSGDYGISNLGNSLNAPAWTQVHGNSGGVALNAGAGHTVKVSNHSGNGAVLVGFSGGQAPVSGTKGIMINPGTDMEFRVTNSNLLSAVAHKSGDFISYVTYG